MLLYLMRHGIAQNRGDPEVVHDAERRLTNRGIKRTRQVARGLRRLDVAPALILTSPLVRARETAEIVWKALRLREALRQTEALAPEARLEALRSELAQLAGEGEVLCVGHAPSIDLLCAHLLGMPDRPLTEIKKSGVACLELTGGEHEKAELRWLLEPGMLRRLARP